MQDRRMDISTLCSAPAAAAAAAELPPLAPARDSISHPTATTSPPSTGKTKKRSRRLSNSERGKLYRSRRKNYVQALEEQVDQLKKEVDQLHLYEQHQQQHHQQQSQPLQLCRHPGGTAFAQVVSEYFSLFKYGVPVTENAGAVTASLEQVQRSSRQAAFLNGLMHPNMVFGQSYGVQELLTQWEKYSLYHAELKYEVKSLQIMAADPNPVVRAPATLYVRFTRRTIEKIFPHVLWNEALVQRLIGMELEYPVGNTFYFGEDHKIHRYDTYVDFVAAFVRVLGSLEDTMTMMESALIRQESMIGDLLEEPPHVKVEHGYLLPRVELVESDGSSSESSSSSPTHPSVDARMSLQSIL